MNFIRKIIDARVDARLNELISTNNGLINFVDVDDANAESMIRNFILQQKKENKEELTTYDFVVNLRLPATQIDNVMHKFESSRLVKEI